MISKITIYKSRLRCAMSEDDGVVIRLFEVLKDSGWLRLPPADYVMNGATRNAWEGATKLRISDGARVSVRQ